MGKDLRNKELGLGIIQRKDGLYMARFTNKSGKRIALTDPDLKCLRVRFEKAKVEDYESQGVAARNYSIIKVKIRLPKLLQISGYTLH